ncbi:MAG: hypothetical protein WKG00_11850 [Polyangiaceae bacterium]
MIDRALLVACGLLVGALAVGGCGDDDEDSATGVSGGTGNTGNTGGSGATGNAGGAGATGGTGATGGSEGGSGGTGGAGATPDCAAYCTAVMTNCTGDLAQWADEATCVAACGTWDAGTMVGDTSDNTTGCHQYHAGAAMAAPEVHCVHAGPAGGGACGDLCDNFCALAESECSDAYATPADCAEACAGWDNDTEPFHSAGSDDPNTKECALYHLTAAVLMPDPHCTHVGPTGGPCALQAP